MKWFGIGVLVFFLLVSGYATAPGEAGQKDEKAAPADSGYNAELAAQLGADDYGMKRYVMAFLKSGPHRSQDSLEAARLQKAHLDNIKRMAEEGQLVLAGPFLDGGEFRGIYVFDVPTVEEARKLTETDPMIQSGRLVMDLHPWYGPAALLKILELNKAVTKKTF